MRYYTTLENRQYLAMIKKPKRRLWWKEKDVGVEYDLMNNLGFNLCVAPQSLVMRLVAYFRVEEVIRTEILRKQNRNWSRQEQDQNQMTLIYKLRKCNDLAKMAKSLFNISFPLVSDYYFSFHFLFFYFFIDEYVRGK